MVLLTGVEKESPENILKQSTANLDKITQILKTVKDNETSKIAIPKLKEIFLETETINNNWRPVMEKMEQLGKEKNEKESNEFKKHFEPLTIAYGQLTSEKNRVLLLKDTKDLKNLIESKEWLKGYMAYIFSH